MSNWPKTCQNQLLTKTAMLCAPRRTPRHALQAIPGQKHLCAPRNTPHPRLFAPRPCVPSPFWPITWFIIKPDLRLGSSHKIPTISTLTRTRSQPLPHQSIVKQNHSQAKIDATLKHKPYILTSLQPRLEVFIRLIGSVSDGCYSVRLHFGSVIFRLCVTTGHTRVESISHGSVRDRLFKLSG